jgi:hypothetical protein
MTVKSIEKAALKLPVDARGKLAAALLSSLDEDAEEHERIWVDEAERRYRSYRLGHTKATSAKVAIAMARAALK